MDFYSLGRRTRIVMTVRSGETTLVNMETEDPEENVWGHRPRIEGFIGAIEPRYRAVLKGTLNKNDYPSYEDKEPLKEHDTYFIGTPIKFVLYGDQRTALVRTRLADRGRAERDLANLKNMFSVLESATLEEESESELRSRIEQEKKEPFVYK